MREKLLRWLSQNSIDSVHKGGPDRPCILFIIPTSNPIEFLDSMHTEAITKRIKECQIDRCYYGNHLTAYNVTLKGAWAVGVN